MINDVTQVIKQFQHGKLVCFDTETVAALSCLASNKQAIDRIYELKQRNRSTPLALMVSQLDHAHHLVEIDSRAHVLANAFFPGPLTIILPKKLSSSEAKAINPWLSSLAIRIPNAPFALDFLARLRQPIVATSTNISGQAAAQNCIEANRIFGDNIDYYAFTDNELNHATGNASTIIDLTEQVARLVRIGDISAQQLESVLGTKITNPFA